jgi:two-component system, OmpR family, response regulator
VSDLEVTTPHSREGGHGLPAGSERPSQLPPRVLGILIVDDEFSLRHMLNIGMRQQGFAVWVAAGGQEALELYRCHHESIDVVLLDVRMPGLDGPRTLAALRELNPQVRCCFMSGDPGSYTEAALRDVGAAAVLPKPFHLAEVGRMLLEVAGRPPRVGRGEPSRL